MGFLIEHTILSSLERGKLIMALAGLILSIVGLALSFFGGWLSIIALPVSIVGLILAIIGGKQLRAAGQPTGLATAGLVVGIIAVVISGIFFFTCGICVLCVANALNEAMGSTDWDAAVSDILANVSWS